MILNKYIKGAALALSALALTSCASDYLDTPSYGSVPAEDICKTPETARMAMLGVCGRGMAAPNSNSSMTPAQALWQGETGVQYYQGEIPASDCYVNFIFDQAPSWAIFYNMEEGYLSSGQYVWGVTGWYTYYAWLGQINEILYGIDGAETNGDATQIALRDFTKGQALTMRAYCYWRLMQMYAPRWQDSNNGEMLSSIVLRLSPKDPQDMAVSPMKDIMTQCYKDLDEAIKCFDAAGRSFRTLNFEVDQNVCYGVYARVAAIKQDWATVKTMAHNARQGKRMPTKDEALSGYLSYNKDEWMWSPSFEQIDNWIYGNWCTFFTCNGYAALNARYTNSINLDLYRLIPEGDARADWWLTHDKLSGIKEANFYNNKTVNAETGAFKNNNMLKAARAWLDERRPSTVTGDDAYANASTGDDSPSLIRDGAQVKFWVNGMQGQDGLCEVPYMRAAEMYLLEAEACAELGQTAEAQALLVEINKNFNPSYTCSLTGQALIDEVRLYTRVELWGEGFCWFNLKRWGLPMQRTAWVAGDATSGNIPAGLACDVPTTRNAGWRYGIPGSERSYNNLITEPIPGQYTSDPE